MKKELKVRVERFGKTVIGQVLDMDDSERERHLLFKLDDNEIINELLSYNIPYMTGNRLYIRGKYKLNDKDAFQKTFDNEVEAQQAYEDILTLVEGYNKKLNKPKFEESEEYKQQVKMNELLMDMRKWQYENDDPVNVKEGEKIYCIMYEIDSIKKITTDYSWNYRYIGSVYFSCEEKAEECAKVFEDRIKEIYGGK